MRLQTRLELHLFFFENQYFWTVGVFNVCFRNANKPLNLWTGPAALSRALSKVQTISEWAKTAWFSGSRGFIESPCMYRYTTPPPSSTYRASCKLLLTKPAWFSWRRGYNSLLAIALLVQKSCAWVLWLLNKVLLGWPGVTQWPLGPLKSTHVYSEEKELR